MRYIIAIEPGTETVAYGVVVPDLPGCFSAGDTLDEAMLGVEEAIATWIDVTLDAGAAIPAPSGFETVRANPDYADMIFGVASVDHGFSIGAAEA